MRILYLINAPGRHLSGAGRRTLALAAREAREGAEVIVAAPPGSGIHDACSRHGLRHVDAPMTAWPWAVRELRRTVREIDADVVHAMSFVPLSLAGLTGGRRSARPATFVSILVDPSSPHPMARKRFRGSIMRARNALARRQGGSVDAIFAVSEAVRDGLARLGIGGRVVVARATVDVESLQERATAPADLPNGHPRVGMAAVQLVPAKGAEHLLRAFTRVVEHYPDAVCLVAGELDQELDLEQLVIDLGMVDRVFLLGFVDDVAPLLCSLDVYVMPSLSEGLNSSVLEAMALERPVVASRVGGIPEAVVDGETGLLVAPADDDDLAEAILRILRDPVLGKTLGRAGLKRVEEHFDIEHFFEVTDAEYRRALADGGVSQ